MARMLTFVIFSAFCLAAVAAECPNACTDDYTPVCGRNRNGELKTFGNLCEFNTVQCENPAAAWLLMSDGDCDEIFATKCNHICTQEYKPICGRNRNGDLKTFGNLCEFNTVQCENPAAAWFVLRDGACMETKTTKCNNVCTDDYTPVCGINRNGEPKTFSNLCELHLVQCENPQAGWFISRYTSCAESFVAKKCNNDCTDDYTPVCARNQNGELKTFSNLCNLNIAQCEKPTTGWFRLRDGACEETFALKCNKICTADYKPVCGRNKNGELNTFGNLCMFNNAQCENPAAGWFMLRAGECAETFAPKCNKVCTADYKPVCGRNQNGELNTFGNLCMFNSAQCENLAAGWFMLRAGECPETFALKCNKVCTADYKPVCGRNKNGELNTFGNLCMFNGAQCENPAAGWFILRDGACMETRDTKCSKICSLEYNPVCGRNQNGELKTFPNLCKFNSAQCENPTSVWFLLRNGVCADIFATKKCNNACTDDYRPVCGGNNNGELKTFSNFCEFNMVQCENKTAGWIKLKDVACE